MSLKLKKLVEQLMPSLTEWYYYFDKKKSLKLRTEDINKTQRLAILHQILGIDYQKPHLLQAENIATKEILLEQLSKLGYKIFSLRLIPLKYGSPKIRTDRENLKNNIQWLLKQHFDYNKYQLEILPHHKKTIFSTIFVITKYGIAGEIIQGAPWQLVQGLHQKTPVNFHYDYKKWNFSKTNKMAIKFIKKATAKLKINDQIKRKLKKKIKIKTSNGYLEGYFETMLWPEWRIIFVDYNRLIYKTYNKIKNLKKYTVLLGNCINPGVTFGKIRIVNNPKTDKIDYKDIMVCKILTVDYIPLIKKVRGIIAEHGGLLSHASIIMRELKTPFIIKVKNATRILKNNDYIELNATKGIIVKLSKSQAPFITR